MKKLLFLFLLVAAIPALAADSPVVIMNTESLIYHHPSCSRVESCTKNCIKTTRDEAVARGARACRVCGG